MRSDLVCAGSKAYQAHLPQGTSLPGSEEGTKHRHKAGLLYMQDEASTEAAEDPDVEGPEESELAAEQSQEGIAPASRVRPPRKARRDRDRRHRRRYVHSLGENADARVPALYRRPTQMLSFSLHGVVLGHSVTGPKSTSSKRAAHAHC